MNLFESIEKSLIRHCSPTLASLKTASLFTLGFTCHKELNDVLREWNKSLSDKGVAMIALRETDNRALIYVFRKNKLREALCCPKIKRFLQNNGQNCKCTGCWKVYCNECEAAKTFARFKKCETVYMRLWEQGRSVRQLTVAA